MLPTVQPHRVAAISALTLTYLCGRASPPLLRARLFVGLFTALASLFFSVKMAALRVGKNAMQGGERCDCVL